MISVTEDRRENGERSRMVENGAESDSRGLHGWKVWQKILVECVNQLLGRLDKQTPAKCMEGGDIKEDRVVVFNLEMRWVKGESDGRQKARLVVRVGTFGQ